LFNETNPQY